VTDAAKWLYYQSLHAPYKLVGYSDYLAGDSTQQIIGDSYLQEAIWRGVCLNGTTTPLFNDDPSKFTGPAVTWYNAAVAAVEAGWDDADLVWVINPADTNYSGSGVQAQSQLYERESVPVPEPATLILLGTCLFGFLAYVRPWQNRKI
jgi:hypothetical protein